MFIQKQATYTWLTLQATMTNRRERRHSKAPAQGGKSPMPKKDCSPMPKKDCSPMPTKDCSPMRHRYYIVRPEPNKTCVPMIAVDELPTGLQLKGVPTTVTLQQIQEWDMARVGADVQLKYTFETDYNPQTSSQHSQQPSPDNKHPVTPKTTEVTKVAINERYAVDEEVSGSAIIPLDSHVKPEPVRVETEKDPGPMSELQQQANVCRFLGDLDHVSSFVNRFQDAACDFVEQSKWDKENDRSKTQDAATPGIYGKKKFCTHWIRTGNCDYMQEGCRYLHVIPDAETRLRIGIRDMPRWAKEDLPSPPRETHRVRRHSSSPPKASKKDTHKDWRNRGNRKAHAELPAGPPLTHPVPMRSLTPTPQSSVHVNQHGPEGGSLQMQRVPLFEDTRVDLLGALHTNGNTLESVNSRPVPQNSQSGYDSTLEPQMMQPAAAASAQRSVQPVQQTSTTQVSSRRPQLFSPLLSNSSPLPPQSPPPSGFYGGPSFFNHTRYGYRPSTPIGNYGPSASAIPSTAAPSYDPRDSRLDDSRWIHPFYQSRGLMNHHMQFRSNPVHGPSAPAPWSRGLLNSPTPSVSDASIGTIGHGRPTNSGAFSPIPGPPVLHKRLFRQPGEAQYVEAQPEPKGAMSKDGSRNRFHKGKGMTAYEEAGESGGRSGQLGNLIALDG